MNRIYSKKAELLAIVALLCAALFWGVSYPLTKYVENCPTFYIISIRFAMAAVALFLCFFRRLKTNFHIDLIKYSFILSIFITAMYILNIIGVRYTTSVRSSFFTTLSFLIVPVLNYFFYKIKISKIIVISTAICLLGLFMLCYSPDMGGMVINFGDFLCILASIAGAINIIFIGKMTKLDTIDTTLFTAFLMAFVSIWGTIVALFTGEISYTGTTKEEMIAIVIMGLFCSAGAFVLQTYGSRIVPTNRIGIILALEPASGCILSVIILHEAMALIGWLGALTIMISIMYMEIATGKSEAKEA